MAVQEAVELEKRFSVERDAIHGSEFQVAFAQTVFNGVFGKRRVMFLAREPFLLRGGENLSVAHQARGAVVIKR